MTRFDQLRLEVRAQAKRIAALEAAQAGLREHVAQLEVALAARRVRRKRPQPDHVDVHRREELWSTYVNLEAEFGHGRIPHLTKQGFAIRHRINADEICRWLSYTAKRGIPEGSAPDQNIRRALAGDILKLEEIQRIEAKRNKPSSVVCHGSTLTPSFSRRISV